MTILGRRGDLNTAGNFTWLVEGCPSSVNTVINGLAATVD